MGQLIKTICQECLDEQNYAFGIGQSYLAIATNMLLGDLSWLEEQVSRPTFKAIKELSQKHKKEEFPSIPGLQCDFSAELFECKNCNTVETHNDIKITFDDEETYQVEWNCDECKALQTITTKPITKYACKKCGSTLLKETGRGIWD